MFVLGSFCNQSGALFFNAWKFSTPSRVRNTMARKKEMATSTAHLYSHFASAKSLWILFVIFKPSLHCRTRISKVHNAACIFMVHGNRRVYVQAWTYGHPMSRFSFHGGESKRQQLARTFEELKWTSENTLNGSVFVYVCSCVQFGEILLSILHRINRKQKRKALVFSTLQKKVLKLPAHTTEKKTVWYRGRNQKRVDQIPAEETKRVKMRSPGCGHHRLRFSWSARPDTGTTGWLFWGEAEYRGRSSGRRSGQSGPSPRPRCEDESKARYNRPYRNGQDVVQWSTRGRKRQIDRNNTIWMFALLSPDRASITQRNPVFRISRKIRDAILIFRWILICQQ